MHLFHLATTVTRMTTTHHLMQAMAAVVDAARKEKGLSQREVSDLTGVPLTTLTRKLKGDAPLNVLDLARLSEVVGLSLTELSLRAERLAATQPATAA